jgi:hypothetical protein
MGLSADPVVLVKRSLIQALRPLCELASPPEAVLAIVGELAREESASVVVEIPPVLAALGPSQAEFVLSTAEVILASPVWQARAVLVENLPALFPAGAPREFVKKVTLFQPLPAIRAAIARQLPFVFASRALDDFGQFAGALVSDADPAIRVEAATALGALPPEAADVAGPALATALGDREHEVRVAALRSVASSGFALDAAAAQLAGIASEGGWRARTEVARILPKVAKGIDGEALAGVLSALLGDDAAEVRKAAREALPEIVAARGEEWRDDVVLPIVRELAKAEDYHLRKSAIDVVVVLGLADGKLADVIQGAAKDTCANVRLVLARELPRGNPVLAELRNDSDPDVAFYAGRT